MTNYKLPNRITQETLIITLVMSLLITLFELTKNFLFPSITIWQSHWITIAFSTFVGGTVSYIILKKIHYLYDNALKGANERRILEEQVSEISETEKRNIGKTLHDGLGQHLTGISYMAKALSSKLKKENHPSAEQALKTTELLTKAVEMTRNLAKEVYPEELEQHGILIALEALVNNVKTIFSLKCTLTCSPSLSFPTANLERDLYYIAQEAVNNAVKHSSASVINISLLKTNKTLTLKIIDNGIGIDPAKDSGGLGLSIIKYRSNRIGAVVKWENNSTGGTVVTCILKEA